MKRRPFMPLPEGDSGCWSLERSRFSPVIAYFPHIGPKKGTGTVGIRPNHFETRLSTEPVPIFGLASLQFELEYQNRPPPGKIGQLAGGGQEIRAN